MIKEKIKKLLDEWKVKSNAEYEKHIGSSRKYAGPYERGLADGIDWSDVIISKMFEQLLFQDDEQTQPGLLPCPFCGDEAIEVVCPWNSEEIAITCPSTNCLVFGRQGIGDRKLIYGPRLAAINWWNKRANKTQ